MPGTLTSGNWTATAGVDKIDVVVTTPPSDGGSTITDYEWELNASGTWVYNASSDYGVPATILVSNAGDIPVGTRMMEIRAAS